MNNFSRTALISIVSVTLLGCGDSPDQEAKKLGFSSVTEMNEIQAQGWHTKARYDDDQAIKQGYPDAKTMIQEKERIENERRAEAERQLLAQQKAEAEKRAEEERRQKAIDNDPYPYIAIISCGMNGWENINALACFAGSVGTELELKSGGKYGLYKAYNIANQFRETQRGIEIPLSKSFELKAQNSQKTLLLGVRIFNKYTNEVLFEKQVAQYGVISVRN